ncbi:MAG: hypothetical protein MMC23_007026, partial [Stictis urceolatum]|nr:hypothetical protein [Stictis urceolata]
PSNSTADVDMPDADAPVTSTVAEGNNGATGAADQSQPSNSSKAASVEEVNDGATGTADQSQLSNSSKNTPIKYAPGSDNDDDDDGDNGDDGDNRDDSYNPLADPTSTPEAKMEYRKGEIKRICDIASPIKD